MSATSSELRLIPLRALYPITALLVIAGTPVWGPFVSLALAYGWWQVVARIG